MLDRPIAIDLFCGLGGWTEGLLAEGYRVVGFDIERHVYGEAKYPAQLVIQDVLTIHGKQFKDAALIVASPPCQEFSYMAMPWSLAKKKRADYLSGKRDRKQLTALFDACFRIQREAIEAAGHHIPMVVENVRGANEWVGRSRWNFGSFHLWGDVPALMPMVKTRAKVGGISFSGYGKPGYKGQAFNGTAEQRLRDGQKVPGFHFDGSGKSFQPASVEGVKTIGHANKRDGHSHMRHLTNQAESDGIKHGGDCFNDPSWAGKQGSTKRDKMLGDKGPVAHSSKSSARKHASAQIAKIPAILSRHIARVYYPSVSP